MEREIVDIAIENVLKTAGIQGTWNETGPLDGVLQFILNGRKQLFTVEVKQEVRTHQLRQIEEYHRQYDNLILVANHIFPKIKEELRQKGIPYLEANGNVFLKRGNIFLLVDTQKTIAIGKNRGNRAFTKTGLKVLFYLLQYKEAINLTQRELAENADVGLGNIPQVLNGLKQTGYIIPVNNKTYVWENRKNLLDRWIAEYGTILRPKLKKEQYTLRQDWQELTLDNNKTKWGGEPAADLLTNHLRPEKFLMYTRENRMELIKNYGLIPNEDGGIEVLEMFWKQEKGETVPPLLVYADLLLEGGKRNKETAEKIYNEYIQPNL
jgi:hypothetical protein